MASVWCIEDDISINELYSCVLESYKFDYKIFENSKRFWEAIKITVPDLILLDIMLPEEDGFNIIAKLKNHSVYKKISVIFVSAKGDEVSKVKGLNLGADDYMTKPFSVLELVARINANLRNKSAEKSNIVYKDIAIDESRYAVKIGNVSHDLPKKEYSLLKFFVTNAGKILQREEIFGAVWGDSYMGETRTLDMHVSALRSILVDTEIKTIRGVGFMLE